MPDGIDTAMHPVQAACVNAAADPSAMNPSCGEVRQGHHAVLTASNLSYPPIDFRAFCTHVGA